MDDWEVCGGRIGQKVPRETGKRLEMPGGTEGRLTVMTVLGRSEVSGT